MADKKISELNSVSLPLSGTEVIPIVQGGETKKITADDLKSDRLSNDISDYTTATLPLSDTDKLLINQGGTFKEVAKSELGGGIDVFSPFRDNFFIGTIRPNGQGVTSFTLSAILNNWTFTGTLEAYTDFPNEFTLVGLKSTTTTAGSSLQANNTGLTRSRFTANNINKAIYWFVFRNSDAVAVADARFFVGLYGQATPIGNVNPSTLLNCFGFGADSGDTNIHLIHNDASGLATKVDLGVNFPANTQNVDTYFPQFFIDRPNGIWYARLTRLNTGHVSSIYQITTNVSATNLDPYMWRNNGSTALEVKMRIGAFLAAQITN